MSSIIGSGSYAQASVTESVALPPALAEVRAVAEPQQSSSPTPIVPPPVCAACDKEMRLMGRRPHSHYINLDQYNYACDCGELSPNLGDERGQAAAV